VDSVQDKEKRDIIFDRAPDQSVDSGVSAM